MFEFCYAASAQMEERAPFLSSPESIILSVSQSWSELGMVLGASLTPQGGDNAGTTLPASELKCSLVQFCQLRVIGTVKS